MFVRGFGAWRAVTAVALLLGASACESDAAPTCAEVASEAMRACVADVSVAWRACYEDEGRPCGADEASIVSAAAELGARVSGACRAGDFGALAGDAVADRLAASCRSEGASVAWRTFGGPQGAAWAAASEAERGCLLGAHQAAAGLMGESLALVEGCLLRGRCDEVEAERGRANEAAAEAVAAACSARPLAELIAVNPDVYVERAAHQVDCLTATTYADTAPLALSCGPTNADFTAPRGEWVQVVVDGEKWGTLCGDGSPYAFQVRLAPEGEPLDRIVIGMQGGGVCVFEEDCSVRLAANPGLFTAMDDEPPVAGIMSTDPEVSPFAHWTKVFLPYCTQDVFAGGGTVEELGSVSVPRYGSVNARAAVRMVRDVLWGLMDAEGGEGFRADKMLALFGGWSAGGYGTLYNYHWFLDDLQWPRTAGFPDGALALDNGQALGVSGLGYLKVPLWGMRKNLPPYCFDGLCAVGPVLYESLSPRLKQVPEQQLLILTNPRDRIQQADAYFGGADQEAFWINTVRENYCDTKDLPGIHYYFTSVADESVHVVSIRPELWAGEVDGESMRDWFWRAVTAPDTVTSRVEEGDFAAEIPGVAPYPCDVAP